jgi:PAS domain S-box-containing protein
MGDALHPLTSSATPSSPAWFGPDRRGAVDDFWRVYDANIDLGRMMREDPELPELAHIAQTLLGENGQDAQRRRDELRQAFAGDWAPYEAGLRELGALYATRGFSGWTRLMKAFARQLIPIAVETYKDSPDRLAAMLVVKAEFFDRVVQTLGDAYITRMQEILRENEARGAAIVQAAFDGIVSIDDDCSITEFNPAAEAMFGYSRQEVIGKDLVDVLIPVADRAMHRRGIQQFFATGKNPLPAGPVETAGLRKDGTEFPLELGVVRIEGWGRPTITAFMREISARRAAEEAARAAADTLRHSEERHRMLFEASPVPMFVYDERTLAFLAVNDAAIAVYGYSRAELLGMLLPDMKVVADGESLPAPGSAVWSRTVSHRRRDGTAVRLAITSRPLTFEGRAGRLAVAIDVTDKESLEAQLRQSQKMEAVGSLAGGIAHDFNNVLSVILSYSELAALDLAPDDRLRADLDEIHQAGVRATALIRQLLAFSRRQVLQPKTVNLNEVVSGIERMLRRLIGEDIELASTRGPGLEMVLVDPGQIEQVLVNLAVNARDAMPLGGKLTIETANALLDEAFATEHAGSRAGRHVTMSVKDTGTGMTPETQARIFEPFFTTKEVGKGTGLGLSTVFGIVRQSGGTICVESELGKGTTFTVYLPVAPPRSSTASSSPPSRRQQLAAGDAETILLVEDDPGVRALARGILTRAGYRVLEAKDGAEALLASEEHNGAIHLLLTDVVMPFLSGREVAERLASIRPDMRVLYMSGYTDDSIVRHGVLDSTLEFLEKPVTPDALIRKVRDVLNTPAR